MSLLPVEVTSVLSPEVLLTSVEVVAGVALEALSDTQIAKVFAPGPRSSSSSSQQSAGLQLAKQEHVPFVVSLLLTAQKCATALCSACPKLALLVAATVGGSRITFPRNTPSVVWRRGVGDAPKSAAVEWRQLCRKLGHRELLSRMPDILKQMGSSTAEACMMRSFMAVADDTSLEMVLEGIGDSEDNCKQLLSYFSTEAADEEVLLPTGRRIGDYVEAEIVAAGPLVTFRPGGVSKSSTGSSSSSGGSSSSMHRTQQQRSASAHPLHADKVDAAFFKRMLQVAFSCVEYLGAQLCHMQLPGDEAADGNSDADGSAASMPLLTKLLEQHAQLQTGLYLAVQRCAAAGQPAAGMFDIYSAGAASLLQRMWGDSLPGQLSAFGGAVAAVLPVGWASNNAACTNLARLSERQLVRGKAKVCGGCKLVRMCSAEC
jgi:hypothetical protein